MSLKVNKPIKNWDDFRDVMNAWAKELVRCAKKEARGKPVSGVK